MKKITTFLIMIILFGCSDTDTSPSPSPSYYNCSYDILATHKKIHYWVTTPAWCEGFKLLWKMDKEITVYEGGFTRGAKRFRLITESRPLGVMEVKGWLDTYDHNGTRTNVYYTSVLVDWGRGPELNQLPFHVLNGSVVIKSNEYQWSFGAPPSFRVNVTNNAYN